MNEINLCNHTKDDGTPCNAIPVKGTPYCYFHRRYYNPPALPGDRNYQAPLLESHHSIQIAVTELYQAFLTRKIDLKEANFGLQILRLAAKTIAAIEKSKKEEEKERQEEEKERRDPRPLPAQPERTLAAKAPIANVAAKPAPAKAQPAGAPSSAQLNTPAPDPKRRVWDPYGCMPK